MAIMGRAWDMIRLRGRCFPFEAKFFTADADAPFFVHLAGQLLFLAMGRLSWQSSLGGGLHFFDGRRD